MYLQKNITFHGLQRSGNHAIIFWYINNLGGYNDHTGQTFFSNDITKLYYYNHVNKKGNHKEEDFVKEFNYCIKSHENCTCTPSPSNFLIIRDLLNTLISQNEHAAVRCDPIKVISIWKHQIKHYRLRKPFANNIILYNKWVVDKNYRDGIAKMLGIANVIDNTEYVSHVGSGSSFIGKQKEDKLTSYLSRFKQRSVPREIRNMLLADRVALRCNKYIFNIDIENILKYQYD